jgi:hypothetical protein
MESVRFVRQRVKSGRVRMTGSLSAGEGSRRTRAKITLSADMVNMHELGKNFVEEVIEVREAEAS